MIFDPDHMSVFGRQQALELVESLDYSGIVSSHSWSTDDALPRIYALGGMIMPYAGTSTDFFHQWQHLRDFYRQGGTQYFGVGYGADMNGFGAQGLPRGADVPNPVSYPFESFDGSTTLAQQRSGERLYDINVDGVAHYGLYPDWVEDLRMQAGDRIVRDLGRGAEAYLQMWERADGIEGVRCDRWRQRFLTSRGLPRRLQLGDKPKRVLKRAGQPVSRTRTWRFCANGRRQAKPLEKKSGGEASGRRVQPTRPGGADRLDPAQAPRRRPAGRDAGRRAARPRRALRRGLGPRRRRRPPLLLRRAARADLVRRRRLRPGGGEPGGAEGLPEARTVALSSRPPDLAG